MIMGILLVALMFTFIPINLIAEPTIKALIVTGQNNHRWDISSPILKDAL
jgi:hypothetical protein